MPKADRPVTPQPSQGDRKAPPAQPSAPAVAPVVLKSFLGLRPGQYLAILYAAVILLLMYLVLLLPGLRHRGAYYRVSTFPDRATVTVDGSYAGSTPCTVFLANGARTLEIGKPFHAVVTEKLDVRGRVFATLLVPDRATVTRTLEVRDPAGLAAWALLDYQKNPRIPDIISDASWAVRGQSQEILYGFLLDTLPWITEPSQLREMIIGAARAASGSGALTPVALIELARRGVDAASSIDNLPAFLLLALSRADADRLSATPWVKAWAARYAKVLSDAEAAPAARSSTGSVSVGGIAFRGIPAGTLVMGRDDNISTFGTSFDRDLARPVAVDAFYLSATEITNASWQAFLVDTPAWSPAGRDALLQRGLVTDQYLADWTGTTFPAGRASAPVTGVSWHAAQAWCAWFTRRVQSVLPGWTARLPYESEWEWAARGGLRGMPYPTGARTGAAVFAAKGVTGPAPVGVSEPNGYGLQDMLGNVWEWCAGSFGRSTALLSSLDPTVNAAAERALPDGPDRSVRGGGWGNAAGAVKVWTRGAQPSDWCTAWLGFRVALARR